MHKYKSLSMCPNHLDFPRISVVFAGPDLRLRHCLYRGVKPLQVDLSPPTNLNWLVVWNMFFPYIGNNNPNQLIFFSGVETTNQIKKRLPGKLIYKWKVFHIRLSLLCQVLDWITILVWGFSSDIKLFFAKHRIVVFFCPIIMCYILGH